MSEKTVVQDVTKDKIEHSNEGQSIMLTRALIESYGNPTPATLRFVQMTTIERPVNRFNEIKGDTNKTLHLKASPIIHFGALDLGAKTAFVAAMKPLIDAEIAKLPASNKQFSHVVGLVREIEVNHTKNITTLHAAFAFDG